MTKEHMNIVKNIKDVSADLFSSLDIKAMLFSGDKSLKALDPKLLELLKKPGNSQYTQLSPILFTNPTEIVTILFLGNTLFLISSFHATSPFLGSLCYAYHHYLLILGPLTFTVRTL